MADEREDFRFSVEENDILKRITSVKVNIKMTDGSQSFLDESFNGEFKLENAVGGSSPARVFLVKDAQFEIWSKWSHCSISCLNEENPIIGIFFKSFNNKQTNREALYNRIGSPLMTSHN